MKIQQAFSMTVQTGPAAAFGLSGNSITVASPFTLEFDIRRNTLASANTGYFKIYNLSSDHRAQIFHDRYDTTKYRKIVLNAGYLGEPKLPLIFAGNILQAYSKRIGVNWVTEIEAYSGIYAIQNGQVNITFPAGYVLSKAIQTVVSTMPNVSLGGVGNVSVDNSRGLVLHGNSWDELRKLTDGHQVFIDNEKVYVLANDKKGQPKEYIDRGVEAFVVNSTTGLLATPRRYEARIDVDVIFEPRIEVGSLISLESIEKIYNGIYAVIGVNHHGTMSESIGGESRSTLNLWKGTSLTAVKSK